MNGMKPKNRTNIAKHGISFELARQIFDGIVWSRIYYRLDYGETRIISIGAVEQAAIVVVAHTDRQGQDPHHLGTARQSQGKEALP